MDERTIIIYGRHAVVEAITARPAVVKAIHVRDDVVSEVRASGASLPHLQVWSGKKLPVTLPEGATHQGFIALLDRTKFLQQWSDFRSTLTDSSDQAVVILGELQDPHNVGAIIRSAAAFGVSAILIPKHRQAGITGTVVKVSAGMAFQIPIVEIGNVNRTISDLKDAGFFVYGLAGEGATPLPQESFTKPSAFVMGSEGEGLREKTRDHCDTLLTIPMHPRAESLNVAAATATVLYAWSAQHPGALQ